MGLIVGLLTLPLAPVRGTVWIAERLLEQAEDDFYDEGAIQTQLIELEAAREAGTISEQEAERAEDVVKASGLEWTVVRAAWFNQNFSEGSFADDVASGTVALPVGDVLEPFVDADDIADVAVAALTDDRHVSELYEVTGPRLLTFADAVAALAREMGRDLRFVSVPMFQYAETLAQYQVPREVVDLLGYLFTTVLDGRNSSVADGVQRALGRAPRDFTDFARDYAYAAATR